MARELPISAEIQRLILSSEAARNVLGTEIRDLKHKLDVPARIKDSLKAHPTGWLGGSLVAGLASSLLFRKKAKREKAKKKGIIGFLLTLVIAAARPAVKVWLAGRLKEYIGTKFNPDEIPSRSPRRVTPFYK